MLKDHKALELDKILLQLAQKIEPDTDIRHVECLLQETDDAFVLMAKYGAPSFYGMTNVTNALRRAEAGGVLNLAELLSGKNAKNEILSTEGKGDTNDDE